MSVQVLGAPAHVRQPEGAWWRELLAKPCPHCLADVVATWLTPDVGGGESPWRVEIVHDESCPARAGQAPSTPARRC